MVSDIYPEDNLAFFLLCGTQDEYIFYPTNLELADSLEQRGIEYQTAWNNYGHGVLDPVTFRMMYDWIDSLITDAYLYLGMDERQLRIKNDELRMDLYPNPTKGISQCSFHISQYQKVTIEIFEMNGRKVVSILDDYLYAGHHQVQLDVSALPSGYYLVRLQAGGNCVTKKIIKW
jgi:hypothetical protein